MEFIYAFLSPEMDQRPAYAFSHRLRAAVEKPNDTPSPLDYFPGKISYGPSRGFSFGHRPRISYAKNGGNETPGPGQYFLEKEIPVPRPRNSAWSFGTAKRQKRVKSHSPGPIYRPPSPSWGHTKGFSFGTEKRAQPFKPRSVAESPGEIFLNILKPLKIRQGKIFI